MRLALAASVFAGVLLTPGAIHAAVVWRDGFGEGLDATKWYARGGCPAERSAEGWLCYNPANAWAADGYLHLRQTPALIAGVNRTAGGRITDSAPVRDYQPAFRTSRTPAMSARPYLGAMVSTYLHGYGWPSKAVYGSWGPGTRIEARIKFSGADNLWQGFIAYSTDQEQVTELDIAEMRGQAERYMLCAVHYDHNATKIHLGRKLPFNWSKGWHVYRLDYQPGWVRFSVDDLTCGTTALPGDAGQIGISFDAKSGNFPWAGGAVFGSPEYLVDWVRVSQ